MSSSAHGRWLAIWALAALAMLAYLQLVGYPEARQRMGSTGLAPDDGVGLFPPWYATQQLVLHGRDPYSDEVAREIQQRVYGRPAADQREGLLRDQHRFAYPLHLSLLLAPTVALDFERAQVVWLAILLAATAASVPWWVRGLGLLAGRRVEWVLVTAVLGALAIQQGLHLQQVGLLVAALLAAAVAAAAAGRFGLAGALLAIATVKPHIALGLAGWMVVWSLGDRRRRRGLLLAFAGTSAVLLGGATVFMPDWLARWFQVLTAYPNYTGARPLVLAIFGGWGGVVAGMAVAALIYYWWRNRRVLAGTSGFRTVVVVTLAVQMLLIPTWIGHNQVLLVPVALVAALEWRRLWSASLWARLLLVAMAAAVLWERATAAALAAAHLAGQLPSPSPVVAALPVYPLFFYPLLAALFAVKYAFARQAVSRRNEVVVASV